MTIRVLGVLLACGCACDVQAVEFCVTDSTQFQAALTAAATNGQDDVIRLATGTYETSDVTGQFLFDSALPANGDSGSLTLSGGWSEFFGNPCGLHQELPWATVIDGRDATRGLELRGREGTVFAIRFLTFAFGNPQTGSPLRLGGGLWVRGFPTLAATVTIERNVFLSNDADRGGGLFVSINGDPGPLGRLSVVNNLFLANHCADAESGRGAAALLDAGADFDALYFSNNTVLDNTAIGGCNTGGVYVSGSSRRYVVNNILWGNDSDDLTGSNGSPNYQVLNNNYESLGGVAPDAESGNITDIAPAFQPGLLSYTPVRGSPLVDAGRHPTPITQWPGFYLTEKDLDLKARVIGGTVDIGAYENERIFRNGFEPFE